MKYICVFLIWVPLFVFGLSWLESDQRWRWLVSLFTFEIGHLVAIPICLAAVGAFFFLDSSIWRNLHVFFGVVTAFLYLLPAIGATWISGGNISWARLFTAAQPPEVKKVKTQNVAFRKDSPNDMILYLPDSGQVTTPVVLMVHGGGWNSGDPSLFEAWDRELAAHGFAVAAMTYRFAPENKWPAQREDVSAAFDWIQNNAEQFGLDQSQIYLLGRSAGAQIAIATAFTTSQPGLRGCISFYGPMDMKYALKYARADDVLNSLKLLRDYLGEDEANYIDASPWYQISDSTPDLLMIHGSNDPMVWVKQSRRLKAKMDEAGRPCEFTEVFWATHGCDYLPWSPGGQLFMSETLRFLGKE